MSISPATYGGTGWSQRERSHREDIIEGAVWRPCGIDSEVNNLLEVMLACPTPQMFPGGSPNDFLLLEWPHVERLREQAEAIADVYRSQGVTVHWAPSNPPHLPNFLFQRDLFFMTPEGAVLARPASPQRAGEARFAAAALAALGVPILATPTGHAVFEGADALWLNPETVMIGVGLRTNEAGAAFVSHLLRDMGVSAVTIKLPPGVQHLLGTVNFIDRNLAAIRRDKVTDELLAILRHAGVEAIAFDPARDVVEGLGMNFVALAPRRVIMPGGCPSVRQRLADAGVVVYETDISEYGKAAGGIGCLTGILRRQL